MREPRYYRLKVAESLGTTSGIQKASRMKLSPQMLSLLADARAEDPESGEGDELVKAFNAAHDRAVSARQKQETP